MPLSSLIFVVILAVWAVYLVQHWIRRRDHLATARSVDRFSESMRVLERRRALPRPDLAEPAPRSYSVSPLRPARPEVVVKPVAAGATAVKAPPTVRRARTVARLRGAALLLGSVTMVTLVGLSLFRQLPPWAALVGVLVMAVAVGGVRLSASAGRKQAPARRTVSARQVAPRGQAAPVAAANRPVASADRPVGRRPVAGPSTQPAELATPVEDNVFARQSVAVTTRTARRSVTAAQLYDIDQVEAAASSGAAVHEPAAHHPTAPEQAVARSEAEVPAGSWSPVPVPPPTYTLKAKAYRPSYTGGSELPADGNAMALDEEFEDLPRIESVG